MLQDHDRRQVDRVSDIDRPADLAWATVAAQSAATTPATRLDLAPIPTFTGAIGCIGVLAHHALEAMAFGRVEKLLSVIEGVHQL